MTEVMTNQTRAVSRLFSNSKVWVAHLFKLMDLEPQLCAGNGPHQGGPECWNKIVKEAEAAKRNPEISFEKTQGYLVWIKGLLTWHKCQPEMSLCFLGMAKHWFSAESLWHMVPHKGRGAIVDLLLPLANNLLALFEEEKEPQVRSYVLDLLQNFGAIYFHLNGRRVLEFLESVMSWKGKRQWEGRAIAANMLDGLMRNDGNDGVVLVSQHAASMGLIEIEGRNMDEATKAELKRTLANLLTLTERKTCVV